MYVCMSYNREKKSRQRSCTYYTIPKGWMTERYPEKISLRVMTRVKSLHKFIPKCKYHNQACICQLWPSRHVGKQLQIVGVDLVCCPRKPDTDSQSGTKDNNIHIIKHISPLSALRDLPATTPQLNIQFVVPESSLNNTCSLNSPSKEIFEWDLK